MIVQTSRCPGCEKPFRVDPRVRRVFCSCGTAIDTDSIEPSSVKPRVSYSPVVAKFQALWKELHTFPVLYDWCWSTEHAKEWFAEWQAKIPKFSCDCQSHFAAYCAEVPPDFSSAEAFFVWGVRAHNHVSENHAIPRKEPMPLQTARELYGFL